MVNVNENKIENDERKEITFLKLRMRRKRLQQEILSTFQVQLERVNLQSNDQNALISDKEKYT